jgi:hypothetical protein
MIRSLTFDEYAAIDAANWSRLRMMPRSPMHARATRESTPTLARGVALHSLILTPDEFEQRYAIGPRCDLRTKEGKATWAEFEASAGDRICLRGEDGDDLLAMRDAIWAHTDASRMLRETVAVEQSIVWEQDGIACKARPDAWTASTLIDLKSTTDASPDAFERSAAKYGYHGQAAWYLRGLHECGVSLPHAHIIAVESSPPYGVAVYRVSDAAIRQGEREAAVYFSHWRSCVLAGEWPGYQGVADLYLPIYAQDEQYEEISLCTT